jgi:hypothetical protein
VQKGNNAQKVSRSLLFFGVLISFVLIAAIIVIFNIKEPTVQPNTQPEYPRVDTPSLERQLDTTLSPTSNTNTTPPASAEP